MVKANVFDTFNCWFKSNQPFIYSNLIFIDILYKFCKIASYIFGKDVHIKTIYALKRQFQKIKIQIIPNLMDNVFYMMIKIIFVN